MFELDPASAEELEEVCASVPQAEADTLRRIVGRVLADPAGRRHPRHTYTRPFRGAQKYVPSLRAGDKVWELKTNHWRGLFVTREVKKGDTTYRRLVFVPVRGRRFFRPHQCPWPH